MNTVYDANFLKLLKKANVRIRKSFKKAIEEFSKDPVSPTLNNHELKRGWTGYKSIDITSDWRAIYKEVQIAGETVAYFVDIGIHEELYSDK